MTYFPARFKLIERSSNQLSFRRSDEPVAQRATSFRNPAVKERVIWRRLLQLALMNTMKNGFKSGGYGIAAEDAGFSRAGRNYRPSWSSPAVRLMSS